MRFSYGFKCNDRPDDIVSVRFSFANRTSERSVVAHMRKANPMIDGPIPVNIRYVYGSSVQAVG